MRELDTGAYVNDNPSRFIGFEDPNVSRREAIKDALEVTPREKLAVRKLIHTFCASEEADRISAEL